jgi:hypothetical protein
MVGMLRVQVPVQTEPGAPSVMRKGAEGEGLVMWQHGFCALCGCNMLVQSAGTKRTWGAQCDAQGSGR